MTEQTLNWFLRSLQNEGWTLCWGQTPDIDSKSFVETMVRTGDVYQPMRASAVDWSWDRDFPSVDIIACRPEAES